MKPNIPKKNKIAKNFVIKNKSGKYFNGLLSLEDQDKNWTNSAKEARKMTKKAAQDRINLFKNFFADCFVFEIN